MAKGKKIGVISLGCDKNRVDTEKMLAILQTKHSLVDSAEQADVIIVNTCAFLESSREEAIEEILLSSRQKQFGKAQKIIVTGCLPQKFVGELFDELVEVDAFLGVSDYDKINQVIDSIFEGKRLNAVGLPCCDKTINRVLTTENYAYLKIADGCDNHCTYCLIPSIRGKFRSIPKEQLILEVKNLGEVKELILVAQDTTSYGKDLYKDYSLTNLLQELSALQNVGSIRVLYCYPEGITDQLINEFAQNQKIIKYIDIPFQHADDSVLKRMNRKGSYNGYLMLVNKLKQKVKGIAIRSTFIAGFPGETQEQFDTLMQFIKQAQLFNAGFFAYSREFGTPAYRLDGQIPQKIKNSRTRKLYTQQKKVVNKILKGFVGETIEVLAEGFDANMSVYYGRGYFNAPEIDGKVYFFSAEPIEYGQKYLIDITKADGYDLYGDRL